MELHGDFAIECFDPLFYYGKAMLELASVEDRVFTNALPKEEADDDEEDDEMEEQDHQLVGDPKELRGLFSLIFGLCPRIGFIG